MNDNRDKSKNKLNITTYCLKSHALVTPDNIALIIVDKLGSQRKYSYQELYLAVCRLSQGLKSLNLPKSTVISIQASDTYDLLTLFLAAIAADLVPILLLSSLTADEMIYILKDSESRLFVQLGKTHSDIKLPENCRHITENEYETFKNSKALDIEPTTLFNDPAFIFYTSGSSGIPKGVMHAQHAILGREPSIKYWLDIQPNDVVMQTDNLCWTYSMFTGFLDPLSVGATALVLNFSNQTSTAEDQISGDRWLELINYYKVTILVSTPDIYNTILNAKHIHDYKIPSLRIAGSAGAPLADITQRNWQAIFHMPIFIALGMSEISTFISTGKSFPFREKTMGKIQPGRQVTILPIESGENPVPPNTIGMLAINKNELGFMLGYIGATKNKKENFRGDWFLPQDLVSTDEEGYISYFGRADTILKIAGGFRVSPIEVENVLKSHEEVKDVACTSLYDEKSKTDLLIAYIVSDQPSHKLCQQILNYAAQHLSDYKIPTHLYFVSQLPYNKRKKLIRSQLKELQPLLICHARNK